MIRKQSYRMLVGACLLLFATVTFAQNPQRCSVNEQWDKLKNENPILHKQLKDQLAKHKAERLEIAKKNIQKAATTYIIPVVFHIIHNDGPEKISQAQVLDAMRILNEDFNLLNADTGDVDPLFKSIVADVHFEFRLAQLDPNGNCTTGINYYKHATHSTGGDQPSWKWVQDQWTPSWKYNEYLNVYTNTGIGEAYSYGPTPNTNMSGVMIPHNWLGVVGTGTGGYDERSLTHEVGHWFNLDHTWGGGTDAGLNTNCNIDDGIGDTPNCKGSYACGNLNLNTCDDGTGDLKDNIQNYMDYSCCNMFTEGQKTVMISSILSNSQKNLFTSANLIKTGTQDPYIYGDVTCSQPTVEIIVASGDYELLCLGETVSYSYNIDGAIADYVYWQFPGETPDYSTAKAPAVTYSSGGMKRAYLTIYADEYIARDTLKVYVAPLGSGKPSPYFTTFESSYVFSNEFLINNIDNDASTWELVSTTGYSGTNSVRMLNNSNTSGNKDELFGPLIDLSNNSSAVFSFRLAYANEGSEKDRLEVLFTKDCGDNWHQFYKEEGSTLATTTSTSGPYVPTASSEWREETFDLPAGYMVEDVQFKFVFTSKNGNSLYIDDINASLTGLDKNNPIDRSLRIFPNPIRSTSVIEFNLPNQEEVTVDIYDVLGRKASTKNHGKLSKGSHQLELGKSIFDKNGIYFVKVRFNNEVVTRKVVRN